MNKELKFAINLAKDAGKILMSGLDRVVLERTKSDKRDICTNIDIEAEKMIIGKIKKKYPSYKIYSEEKGKIAGADNFVWIIDPIDGTKYYINAIKLFSTSIALWKNNEPIIGVVYFPALNDIYWAEKGWGAFCNQKRIRSSNTKSLKDSIISLDVSSSNRLKTDKQSKAIKRLKMIFKNVYRIRMLGLGTFALCSIAKGGFDGYFDLSGKEEVLDLAAGIIIAKEAGAKITGLDGKYHGQDTSHIVITNGKIHNKFLKLLNSVK